ncbi:MAG: hypothetical protein F6J98_01665 [Moorea sp. SIO4G2]|nr:hypothetical protein [Moorena sp. SIO4G2]
MLEDSILEQLMIEVGEVEALEEAEGKKKPPVQFFTSRAARVLLQYVSNYHGVSRSRMICLIVESYLASAYPKYCAKNRIKRSPIVNIGVWGPKKNASTSTSSMVMAALEGIEDAIVSKLERSLGRIVDKIVVKRLSQYLTEIPESNPQRIQDEGLENHQGSSRGEVKFLTFK